MIPYASHTGTKRNLAALWEAGWRLLLNAKGRSLDPFGFRYALDNGAWSAFQQRKPFDQDAFRKALHKVGRDADWVVVPDIVAGGFDSLDLSLRWLPRVLDEAPHALIAVQNGISPKSVAHLLGPRVGIFVGGDTVWKLETMPAWGKLAQQTCCWLHVGRVNSARRIAHCAAAGAHSFDGTSATRFAVTVRPLDLARRQLAFRIS